MNNVGSKFFYLAVIAVTLGMIWGLQMAATQNHTLKSAHAHLNLVGWVTMALFGIYYKMTPNAASTRLAQIHFWVAAAGLFVMVPGIAMANLDRTEILAVAGSFASFASMLIFGFTVVRHGFGHD